MKFVKYSLAEENFYLAIDSIRLIRTKQNLESSKKYEVDFHFRGVAEKITLSFKEVDERTVFINKFL